MTEWAKYGQLISPFDSLGYGKELYAEKKKKEIFTDSKAYINGRDAFYSGIPQKVNDAFSTMMDTLKDVPFSERERIAKEEAARTKDRLKQVMDSIWPSSDLAYGQQQNINVANAVVAGNVVVDDAKKVKVARAKKTPVLKAKKPKAAKKAKKPKK